jgi:hypothetical protein
MLGTEPSKSRVPLTNDMEKGGTHAASTPVTAIADWAPVMVALQRCSWRRTTTTELPTWKSRSVIPRARLPAIGTELDTRLPNLVHQGK